MRARSLYLSQSSGRILRISSPQPQVRTLDIPNFKHNRSSTSSFTQETPSVWASGGVIEGGIRCPLSFATACLPEKCGPPGPSHMLRTPPSRGRLTTTYGRRSMGIRGYIAAPSPSVKCVNGGQWDLTRIHESAQPLATEGGVWILPNAPGGRGITASRLLISPGEPGPPRRLCLARRIPPWRRRP